MKLYLVSNAVAADVTSVTDPRLHFIGSLVPGRGGHAILSFSVPQLPADSYAAAVWCPQCAAHSFGRRFFVLHVDENVIPRYRQLMLLRVQSLDPAPTACPVTPMPISTPPGLSGSWIGTSPLWTFPYGRRDPSASTIHGTTAWWVKRRGWELKFLWELSADETAPVALSITALATGQPVLFHIGGVNDELTRNPVLDPAHPGIPDPFGEYQATKAWSSGVYFPGAGCYALDASWSGGAVHYVFAFGR